MSIVESISSLYLRPSDSKDEALQKTLLVVSALTMAVIVIPWGALYVAFGNPNAAIPPFAYSALTVLGLAHFAYTKRQSVLRFSQLVMCLILPFFVSMALGGFQSSSAVIIWSFTSPMGAFLFCTRRTASYFFAATIALILITAATEPFQPLLSDILPLPANLVTTFYVLNIGTVLSLVFYFFSYAAKQRDELFNRIAKEQEKSAELLRNILPVDVIQELVATGHVRPARHEETTVLFTDFVGFTEATSAMPADRMVAELNDIFAAFDEIAYAEGLEKIKTIGDSYMAAAGLSDNQPDHALRCTRAALRMLEFIDERNRASAFKWKLRVGIHSGPVVSGIVGQRKYAYDIWGDTVNIASRMESADEPQRINVSAYTYDQIRTQYDCTYRGKIAAKGKGEIDMYFVVGQK
jgi:class 3 adenylate cyclase